jgi:hypothetical protein
MAEYSAFHSQLLIIKDTECLIVHFQSIFPDYPKLNPAKHIQTWPHCYVLRMSQTSKKLKD